MKWTVAVLASLFCGAFVPMREAHADVVEGRVVHVLLYGASMGGSTPFPYGYIVIRRADGTYANVYVRRATGSDGFVPVTEGDAGRLFALCFSGASASRDVILRDVQPWGANFFYHGKSYSSIEYTEP